MKLIGANPNPRVVGLDELPGKSHYFIGNDPQNWHTNTPTYAKVQYRDIYPGIDLIYYGNQRQLEYDLNVGGPRVKQSRYHVREVQHVAAVRLSSKGGTR